MPEPKNARRGGLLFETFVALIFLSVAIPGILRVFGESLFVSQRNVERREVGGWVEKFVFPWFANPGMMDLPAGGDVNVPLDPGRRGSDYRCAISVTPMIRSAEAESGEQPGAGSSAQIQTSRKMAEKKMDYYHVRLAVTKDRRRELLETETVLFKSSSDNISTSAPGR